MSSVSLDFFGLDEIKDYINIDRINKQLAIGVAETMLQFHSVMKHAVFTRYNPPNDLDKALLKSNSLQSTGKDFIKYGLIYVAPVVSLSVFSSSSDFVMGNINMGASKKGTVFSASVKRGSSKIVYGKQHYGGFIAGRTKGSFTKYMYERMQQATWIGSGKDRIRAPIRVLWSMDLVDMALYVYNNDAEVKKAISLVEETIIEKFIP